MRDLADIDRTLGELGQPSSDVKGLLQRALGGERSLDRLDAMLGDLAPGAAPPPPRPPSEPPPKRLGRHARWSKPAPAQASSARKREPAQVEEKVRTPEPAPAKESVTVPPEIAAIKRDGRRSTLVGLPSKPPSEFVAHAAEATEPDEPELSLASEDTDPELELAPRPEPEDNVETETGSWLRPERGATAAQLLGFDDAEPNGGGDPDAVTRIAVPPDGEGETSRHLRSLLDQQLDPAEFPQQPASQAPAADAQAGDESDGDFELLIEDDEILEIEELDED